MKCEDVAGRGRRSPPGLDRVKSEGASADEAVLSLTLGAGEACLVRVWGEVLRGRVMVTPAAEVDEDDQGVGAVEAEGAVADEANLAVKAFEAALCEAEADSGEDALAVRAQGVA